MNSEKNQDTPGLHFSVLAVKLMSSKVLKINNFAQNEHFLHRKLKLVESY